ncbi:AAEL001554-PA [Aedes aegypti]|uniref:AAEL001554-PA n=1 Tax=Aedes aegypti TaxID=7159 RepID=Q17KV2_AEDAE|nr:AAEL001554-PA [Aedes aegypti]
MGLDFEVQDYIKTLNKNSPPFRCPKCDKKYKSVIGLQYHLNNYDHDNPSPSTETPIRPPNNSKQRSQKKKMAVTPKNKNQTAPARESLTYIEQEALIKIEFGGKNINLSVDEEFELITLDEQKKKWDNPDVELFAVPAPTEPEVKLPEEKRGERSPFRFTIIMFNSNQNSMLWCKFKEIEEYNIHDAPARPNAYIRFIEKSTEELDGEVEYDVDEEDTTWLAIMNERRAQQNLCPVPVDSLELLMDRLEKESYFQAAVTGQNGAPVDDDAVCCICMDGECQNTNVILFCDMCNLAVHQDCYGVPYIPEGQWLCRRCLQSPSRSVDCVLCPNTGGAFKQTDSNQWAHVVCALWIPEVRFANTVFLEPIDSIETIPPARWRLVCYICKQKGIGACIQCNRSSCYAAFHVTCAQQAGLCMRMDQVRGNDTHPIVVQKTAYCDAHTPINALGSPGSGGETDPREACREKMKKARKMLAIKRTSAPVILIPTIPPNRVEEIASLVNIAKKQQFIQRLIAYWTLKRQHRNGVPLLRRLQSQGQAQGAPGRDKNDGSPDARELYQQLKYWQCLRQDLERARLLCELVRKREKLKLIMIKTSEQCVMAQLNPIESVLHRILDQLEAKDIQEIFREPVDTEEVADYLKIITHPMDLGTMRQKLKSGYYTNIEDLEADFTLMVTNCMTYNNKDTMFYRAGVKMRDAGTIIFRTIRKELERAGLLEKPQPPPAAVQGTEDTLAIDIEAELNLLAQEPPSQELIEKLQQQLAKAGGIRHGMTRAKKVKHIRAEIAKIKRALSKEPEKPAPKPTPEQPTLKKVAAAETATSKSLKVQQTPPASPNQTSLKIINSSLICIAFYFNRDYFPSAELPSYSRAKPRPPSRSRKRHPRRKRPSPQRPNCSRKRPKKQPEASAAHRTRANKPPESGDRMAVSSTYRALPEPEGAASRWNRPIPDSFRVYRGGQDREISDSDDSNLSFTGSTCSSCSGFSGSGTESEFGSSSMDDNESFCDSEMSTSETEAFPEKPALEPLKLVWAKCRGYPWYPALIIDPDIPSGFVHNGVPLPAPPADVLALKANYEEQVFLVLFFDVKRTWQWLPANKLELLGVNKELDQSKLVESRKPTERKAVNKAYQEALHYHSQVSSADGPAGKL